MDSHEGVHAAVTSHASKRAVQRFYKEAGGDEKIVAFIPLPEEWRESDAADALAALSNLNSEQEDSFAYLLDKLFELAFQEGMKFERVSASRRTRPSRKRRCHHQLP